MARSRPAGPPVPEAAERARALAARARTASVIAGVPGAADDPDHGVLRPVAPTLHHVPASGAATLQLPDDHPMVARTRRGGHLPVMLELTDTAPVRVRQPVRGLLWLSGRLRVLPDRVARRAALRIAGELPDERLLDVGHGATLLRLDPGSVVLSDAEGTAALTPAQMAAAPPDPLLGVGDGWLAHLEHAHPAVLRGLAGRLPPPLRRPGHRLAPLAVDRWGLRLRVESEHGDHDVRLAFDAPVTCPRQLGDEIRRLAGCAASDVRPARHRRRDQSPAAEA